MITQDELKQLVQYIPETGNLVYKKATRGFHGSQAKNKPIGTVQPNGYRLVMIKRKRYLVHRLIWLYHHGEMPKIVDHINRDKTDNRIENLREVTRKENSWNTTIKHSNQSTTGYRGVCYLQDRDRFLSYCHHEGKFVFIGHFDDPHSAAEAYNEKVLQLRGEYASLNEIRTKVPKEFRNVKLPDWMK